MLRYHGDMAGFTWAILLNNNNKLSYCLYFVFLFFEDGTEYIYLFYICRSRQSFLSWFGFQ